MCSIAFLLISPIILDFPFPCHYHPYIFINSGIVTRCPLELKMKRKKEGEEWYGKISYEDFEEEIDDPADVEKKIREGTVYRALKCHYQKQSIDGAAT